MKAQDSYLPSSRCGPATLLTLSAARQKTPAVAWLDHRDAMSSTGCGGKGTTCNDVSHSSVSLCLS